MGRTVDLHRAADGRVTAHDTRGVALELDELLGVILGWFHAADEPPAWRVEAPSNEGWTPYRGHLWSGVDSHPQETSENSVDIAHFATVHRYRDIRTLREAEAEGPLLEAEYHFTRSVFRRSFRRVATHTDFTVQVWGLGFSFVETDVRNLGLRTRQLVMATPTDGERIDLRVSAAVSRLGGTGPLARLGCDMILRGLMRAYVADVADDFDIWEHKRYLDRPIVVDGDGPIHRYRRWAKQFYVGAATLQAATGAELQ
jgi:hypothetical protein